MLKVNNELSLQLVGENFFIEENDYNFRHESKTKFKVDHVNTEEYGKLKLLILRWDILTFPKNAHFLCQH